MPFQLPRYNVCCCGCSLKTGVYIIGVINVLLFLPPTVVMLIYEIKEAIEGKPLAQIEFFENDFVVFGTFTRFLLSVFLLYGCYHDNPSYIMGFFTFQMATVILYVLFTIMHIFLHIIGVTTEVFFIFCLLTVLQVYSALIVHSHYQNLKEGRSY